MVKRLRHHPFTVVTGVRFPLESPKYGRFARPYFFGESHPCYAYCFAIRDRLHAIAPRHLVPRRPLSAIAVRRFPLESPKYGRCTRPYFFGESHPCYAYCFAIRDKLHARVPRHYRALPFPNLRARCKAAHISAMQTKPFLVQVVLGFSFSVGLSQCLFRSRRAACLFNHPPQCHKMSN